ncbi:hypothetical protein RRG08_048731, partial [Elysia crispata]
MAHARSDYSSGVDNTGFVGETNSITEGAVLKHYKGESPQPELTPESDVTSNRSPSGSGRNSVVSFRHDLGRDEPDVETDPEFHKGDGGGYYGSTAKTLPFKNGPTPILKSKRSGEPTRGSIVSFRSEPAELSKTSGLEEENEEEEEEEEGKRDDHEEKKTLDEEEKKETEKMREKDVTIDIQDSPPSMTPEQVEETLIKVRQRFAKYADSNNCVSEEQFLEALGENKESFFAERFFRFLDKDRNGHLDMEEITHGARILLNGSTAQKVEFVFTLYDRDGNGTIEREELNQVLTSCVLESKMKLNQNEIGLLSDTMFDEADKDGDGFMSEENLGVLVNQFPDALDALTKNASIWLQPDLRQKNQGKSRLREIFSKRYFANNYKKLTFLTTFWVLNIILFAVNAYIYRKHNKYIIFARGCGMCLNFTSALILLLPLRMCVSYLRLTPLSRILPLDHNISIHKMVGLVIAMWTIGHTAGHLGNAALSHLPSIPFTSYSPLTPAIHTLHLLQPSHTCHSYPSPPTALSHLPPIPSTSYTPLTPATHTLHLLQPSHTCHPYPPPPTPLSHLPPTPFTSYSHLSHLPPTRSTSYTPLTPCHRPHAPPPTPLSHLPPIPSTSYT